MDFPPHWLQNVSKIPYNTTGFHQWSKWNSTIHKSKEISSLYLRNGLFCLIDKAVRKKSESEHPLEVPHIQPLSKFLAHFSQMPHLLDIFVNTCKRYLESRWFPFLCESKLPMEGSTGWVGEGENADRRVHTKLGKLLQSNTRELGSDLWKVTSSSAL